MCFVALLLVVSGCCPKPMVQESGFFTFWPKVVKCDETTWGKSSDSLFLMPVTFKNTIMSRKALKRVAFKLGTEKLHQVLRMAAGADAFFQTCLHHMNSVTYGHGVMTQAKFYVGVSWKVLLPLIRGKKNFLVCKDDRCLKGLWRLQVRIYDIE